MACYRHLTFFLVRRLRFNNFTFLPESRFRWLDLLSAYRYCLRSGANYIDLSETGKPFLQVFLFFCVNRRKIRQVGVRSNVYSMFSKQSAI
jgi:hypothetical protein